MMAMRGSIRVAVLAVASLMSSAVLASAQAAPAAQCTLTSPNFSPDFTGANNQACLSLNSTNSSGYSGSPSFGAAQTTQPSVSTVLRMTSPEPGWATSAWFQTAQTVTGGFSTTFAFQIGGGSTPPADGFAFVIQNSGLTALGPGGCGIGFGDDPSGSTCGPTTGGIPKSVAIEFNTYNNGGSVDPGEFDVAIQSCPNGGANSVDYSSNCNLATNTTAGGVNLADGHVHVVAVTYATIGATNCGPSKNQQCYALHVSLDGTDLFPGGVPFDMTTITGSGTTAYAGFTAATGGDFDEQDIVNWIFAPTVTQSNPVTGTAQTTFPVNGGFIAGGYDLTAAQTSNTQTVQMTVTAIPVTQQACNTLVQKNSSFPNAQCFVYQNGGGTGQDTSVLFEVTCPANANSSCAANSAFYADLGTDFSFNCLENPGLTCPASTALNGGSFGLPHITTPIDNTPAIGVLKGEGPDSTHPCSPFSDGVTPLFKSNQVESFSLGDTSGGAKGGSGGTTSCWVVTYMTQNETPSVTVTSPVQGAVYTQNTTPAPNAKYNCTAVSTGDPNSVAVGPYLSIQAPNPPAVPETCAATDSPGGAVASGNPFDVSTVGSHTFTAQVQDSAMNTNQTVVTYNVVAPPTVSGPTSAIFNIGVPGSVPFAATGYLPTFSEAGALPAGVTFIDNGNGTATLAGTASVTGVFPITVTVKNTTTLPGATATLAFTLNVASSVPASGTKCNGVYDGTFKGNLTVSSGQTCIFVGGGVTGNVAQTGGTLMLTNATVTGNLQSVGGAFAIGAGTTIKGNMAALNLGKSGAQNTVCGATIVGSLQVVASFTPVAIGNRTTCAGNVIGSSLTVTANDAAITIDGNTVGGSLTDAANFQPTEVFSNKIKGSLTCTADASITGGGNTAAVKTGQCASF